MLVDLLSHCFVHFRIADNDPTDIQVFRYDDVTGLVFILAAENVEILMQREGTWRFTER